jgi:hypothetical protein
MFCGISAVAQEDFVMRLDTASVQPGARVPLGLFLDNARGVASFELLIHHDPLGLIPEGVTLEGTRASDFEYLEFQYDASGNPGNIRVLAIADILGQPATPPLDSGSGEICRFVFRVVSNSAYSGFSLPVRFEYLDNDANTLVDEFGVFVGRSDITYYNGWVFVDSIGAIRIGDINLNSIVADVGDAVLFTNYFINPVHYPLNAVQMANTDVNQDGYLGTVADLVRLISWVVQGPSFARPGVGGRESVDVVLNDSGGALNIGYESSQALGAALIVADLVESIDPATAVTAPPGMEVAVDTVGGQLRVLVYSMQGNSLPMGAGQLVGFAESAQVKAVVVELASATGEMLSAVVQHSPVVEMPKAFSLHQNYPNPFNPVTTISFDIVGSGARQVRLAVYNALGQQVSVLIDDVQPAGPHRVEWDGTDDHGRRVASGVYMYRLESAVFSEARKMLLLK